MLRHLSSLVVVLMTLLLAAPPASGHVQPPTRKFTVARGGPDTTLGYGPRARLKAWREDARSRLCLRLHLPFRFDGEPFANRSLQCVPYPPRRALTARFVVFDDCFVGGRYLLGIVRADVARVDVATSRYEEPRAATLFRSPRLIPDGAVVHAGLADGNDITAYDSSGQVLATRFFYEPYKGCPAPQGVVEFT